MKKDKTLEQLEKIKNMFKAARERGSVIVFDEDIIALDYAIKKVKKDKSYMGSYYQGVWHMFLLILLVKITDTLFTMFWG